MSQPDGYVDVGIDVDTSELPGKLRQELAALERRLPKIGIEVEPNTTKFASDLTRQVKTAAKLRPVEVPVSPSVKAADIRREVSAAAKSAKLASVTLPVDINAKGVAREANAAVKAAAATVKPMRLNVGFDVSQVRRAANLAVKEAQPLVQPMIIDVAFSERQLVSAANQAVTAAQPFVQPLDVQFDADATKLVSAATAAVVAAEKAIPKIDVGMSVSQTSAAAAASQASVGAAAAGAGGAGLLRGSLVAGAALLPGAAIAAGFASSINEASALAEAISKTQAVYGEAAADMIKWSEKSTVAMGQSQTEALAAVGTMGNLLQAFGIARDPAADMSRTLTTLASDLASFNDTSVEDALTAITSGLSGETEPLKRFGVALSDARLKEIAFSKGMIKSTKEALNPATKALAAYELIMQDTALAQGDFVRNGDGFANLSRTVAAEFTNLRAAVGTPMQNALLDVLPPLIDTVRQMTPMLVNLSGKFGEVLGPALTNIVPLLEPLVYMFGMLFAAFVELSGAAAKVLAPVVVPILGRLADTIGIVASAIAYHMDDIAKFAAIIGGLFAAFKLGGILTSVGPSIVSAISGIGTALSGLVGFAAANPVGVIFLGLAAGLMAAYRWCEPFREAIQDIWAVLKDNFMPVVESVTGMIMAFFDGGIDNPELLGAFDNLKEALGNIAAVVPEALGRAGVALVDWARTEGGPAMLAVGRSLGSWLAQSFAPALGEAIAAGWRFVTGTVLPTLASGLSTAWDLFKDFTPKAIGFLSDAVNNLVRWLLTDGLKLLAKGVAGILKWVFTDGVKYLGQVTKWLLTDALPFLVRTLLQLVGAAGELLGTIFDVAIEWLGKGLSALGGWLTSTALPWLGQALADMFRGAVGFLGDLASWLVEAMTGAVVTLVFALPTLFVTLWDWFAGLPGRIVNAIESLASLAGKLGDWVRGAAGALVSALPNLLSNVWDWFAGLPGRIADALGDLSGTLKSKGGDLISGFWAGIRDAAEGGVGIALDIARAFVGFVNDKIIGGINRGLRKYWPDWLPGDVPQIPPIPMFAQGGIVKAPTLAMVGEAGPELILPLTDPKRMRELLEEAGLLGQALEGLAGVSASPKLDMPSIDQATLPGIDATAAWAAGIVDAINTVPADLQATTVPAINKFGADIAGSFSQAGQQWVRVISDAGGRMVAAMGVTGAAMVAAAQSIGDRTAAALAGAVTNGVPSVINAVRGYARGIADTLNPILAAVGSAPVALKFARGGWVPGPNVRRDVVPAMLMPREVVIRRDSVEKFGKDALLDINEGRVPRGWYIPGFAKGGEVTADAVQRGRAVAERAVGKPYVWGAVGPDGFDCSGLWSAIINAVQDRAPYRRLFTSASLIDNAAKIGMLPGLGQISVGAFKGNPGHVGGTIAGVNYEATPPRVRKGSQARGANHPIFTHRYHVGSGLWLQPGQEVRLPDVPAITTMGELGRMAYAFMSFTQMSARRWVDANTFVSDTSLADLIESSTSAGSTGQLRQWIARAIELTGVPASWAQGLFTIAMRESAGNPRAINLSDANARRGTPSKGLMQVIDPTFARYHVPGHTNIWDPVANIAAAINYIRARYGDISNVQQANPALAPRGYADGGEVVDGFREALRSLPPTNITAPIQMPQVSDPLLAAQALPRHLRRAFARR